LTPFCVRVAALGRAKRDRVMAFVDDHAVQIERAHEGLQTALTPTADVFRTVIEGSCIRLPGLKASRLAARLERLIAAGAWSEAALALVELEVPAWRVRRLAHEGSEWICALSRQPNLPIDIDDTAEASHEHLALAILTAMVEAQRRSNVVAERNPAAAPMMPSSDRMVCCDNFA
jgi:hypothetical protein